MQCQKMTSIAKSSCVVAQYRTLVVLCTVAASNSLASVSGMNHTSSYCSCFQPIGICIKNEPSKPPTAPVSKPHASASRMNHTSVYCPCLQLTCTCATNEQCTKDPTAPVSNQRHIAPCSKPLVSVSRMNQTSSY